MSEAVVTALITGGLALIGVWLTNRKSNAELFAKLDKQSELSDAKLEREIAVVKTEIKNLLDRDNKVKHVDRVEPQSIHEPCVLVGFFNIFRVCAVNYQQYVF